jgi:cytochrome P450
MNTMPRIEDFKDGFDPFTALLTIGGEGKITAPLEELTRLGRQASVVEGDLNIQFGLPRQLQMSADNKAFIVIGYNAVNEVLQNPTDFSNKIYEVHVGITFGKSITTMDAPIHSKYRKLFQEAFNPKMLAALKPRFEAVIERLIGRFETRGHAELVHEFAVHFPFQFICDLMDLPEADRAVFHKLAHGQTCVMFDPSHGQEASRLLGNYLTDLIALRRKQHAETDFISVLANADLDGEGIPEDVLLGFFRQLMNAGGDTSYHGFSNILAALFMHPKQVDMIRADRSLIPRAIEEGLRWGAPITSIDRITTRDVVLDGVAMPKGSVVRVCIAAANRDETIFVNPHEFDIMREQRRSVVFGFGSHVCIGQHVARMELQMALNVLLDRLENLRLDPAKPAPVIRGLTFRGADAVNVIWDSFK